MRRNHFYYLVRATHIYCCSSRTSCSWRITQSTQRHCQRLQQYNGTDNSRNKYKPNVPSNIEPPKKITQIQKTIEPKNGKESGTKYTQKQSIQERHGDKKYLQKQYKGGLKMKVYKTYVLLYTININVTQMMVGKQWVKSSSMCRWAVEVCT